MSAFLVRLSPLESSLRQLAIHALLDAVSEMRCRVGASMLGYPVMRRKRRVDLRTRLVLGNKLRQVRSSAMGWDHGPGIDQAFGGGRSSGSTHLPHGSYFTD